MKGPRVSRGDIDWVGYAKLGGKARDISYQPGLYNALRGVKGRQLSRMGCDVFPVGLGVQAAGKESIIGERAHEDDEGDGNCGPPRKRWGLGLRSVFKHPRALGLTGSSAA